MSSSPVDNKILPNISGIATRYSKFTMAEKKDHQFCKVFVQKGRVLRNKCAQLKVQERYMDKQPSLFIQGKLPIQPPRKRILIIPSYETFLEFQSVLGLLPLSSTSDETLLVFQSVIRSALASGDQKFQQKCKSFLFDTPSASRVVFLNEATIDTCSDQLEKEQMHVYELRLFVDACLHLQRTLECEAIVLACDEHDSLYAEAQLSGLRVQTIKSYLNSEEKLLGSTASTISNLNLSADEVLSRYRCDFVDKLDPKSTPSAESVGMRVKSSIYSRHISAAEADLGVRKGTLLSGKICVFPHNSLDAEVAVAGGLIVLISGRCDMNRALDGDTVVIRLHPKIKWNRICGSLTLSPEVDIPDNNNGLNEEGSNIQIIDDQNPADDTLMVTGMVVAISRRDISEIVVTVPMSTFDSTSQKALPAGSVSISPDSLERENFILVPPLDMRLPKIRLRTRQWSKLEGHRIIVAFDNWPADSMYPNGHLVRIIGEANDWKTEVESILIRHSIFPRPFSAAAMACVPAVPLCDDTDILVPPAPTSKGGLWRDSGWVMPTDKLDGIDSPAAVSHRRDYRQSRRVFSVDPPGCQDIDDAMNVHWLEGNQGVIEVAVSIADVCAFLPQDCTLDLEAQTRGTTVYLTHMRMDMLPSLISGDIASLHGGKDRFAVTVTWHVKVTHADGRPVNRSEDPLLLHSNNDIVFATPVLHSCGRTAITSVAAMTYAQAHNLIHGRAPDPQPPTVPPGQAGQAVGKHLWEDLRSDLKVLTVFGRFLKGQRELNGALDLTQTGGELKFKLSGEGEPMDVKCKEEMEVHNTIAELMIIANSTVARIIESFKPLETLVRVHSSPPLSQQKEILKLVKQTGQGIFDGNGTSSVELKNQLRIFREKMLFPKSKSSGNQDKKTAESIVDFVTSAVIKSMCEAQYVCAGSLSGNIFSGKDTQETGSDSRLGGHYGLGLGHYTHFTSPIRRYADIIVHRQLLAVLESLGGGSGLKRIQLPSLDGTDGNICVDYSDRSAVKPPDPGTAATSDYLLQGGSSISNENKIQIELPASLVPSLNDVVNSGKTMASRTYYPTHTESLAVDSFPSVVTSSDQPTAALSGSEDDLLNDLLSDTHLPSATAYSEDTSRGYQWDDSFLDNLLGGVEGSADSESALLESCLDSGLDFLLDANEVADSADSAGGNQKLTDAVSNIPLTKPISEPRAEKSKLELTSRPHPAVRAVGDSPYSGDQVQRITQHLNLMNSRSKAVQMECQKMFLRLFFRTRVEVHDAIVYSLRDNGFLAYVPVFDYKGPVYLQNRQEIVCMDPTLLSPTPSALGADEGTNTDPNMFDKRGKELPGYECVLTGERSDSNEAQELLISPKKQGGTKGLGPVLRILPLQRVRVAMTSAPWSGTSGACAIRLVLVSASSSGKAADASKAKKNDVTEDVIQAEEKNKLSLVSNRLQVVTKSRKEMREESLYTALKAALCSQPNGISGSRTGHNNRQAACANRYEILPGRVAFGPQEGVRSIFILTRNKAIEMEKAKERRQEDSAEKSEGQELQNRTNTSTQKKKNFSSYSGTSKELETELLMESLKDGKTAAMLKMQQWGEEWAEEEELPTSWEAGEGGGADTELGKKAASGGFTKELYLATARQSKLKVAKKNSKYG